MSFKEKGFKVTGIHLTGPSVGVLHRKNLGNNPQALLEASEGFDQANQRFAEFATVELQLELSDPNNAEDARGTVILSITDGEIYLTVCETE